MASSKIFQNIRMGGLLTFAVLLASSFSPHLVAPPFPTAQALLTTTTTTTTTTSTLLHKNHFPSSTLRKGPLSPLHHPTSHTSSTQLHMGLDLVTYLRTEFISAALCTNQIPRAADSCLQLGTDDGRAITFIPRTMRTFITSTLMDKEKNGEGELNVSTRRQLKQQRDRRGTDLEILYQDQKADDLVETESESVDVVISLQAAAKMVECGMDWKKSIQEASRVLKPGGRFLFVEQTELNGVSYLDYVRNLGTLVKEDGNDNDDEDGEEEVVSVFSEVGMDDVDLVLVPHVAGVAIKSEDAGLSKKERAMKKKREEEERYAELSLSAFERGAKKKRKRKKKKGGDDGDAK